MNEIRSRSRAELYGDAPWTRGRWFETASTRATGIATVLFGLAFLSTGVFLLFD